MCPQCHHELVVKDLVPVFSWLWLKGRCRYCQKPISPQYPLVELITAGLFVFSYLYWPLKFSALTPLLSAQAVTLFIFWLVFLVGFMALAVYDLRWFLLPNKIVYSLLALALLQVIVVVLAFHGGAQSLLEAFWGVIIGGGIFYLLFEVSKGKWIGGGDVKLGTLLGLIVGGPAASFLLLFIASLLGTFVASPLLLTGKANRTTKLPFGPFLLAAAVIVRLFGASLIAWYRKRLFLS